MSYFVNLAKANAEVKRLSEQLSTVNGEHATATAALAERDAAAESCRAQFDASLADLTEKLSAANATAAKLQAEAKSAGQQAAEIVAAQGLPPSALPGGASDVASASVDNLAKLIRAESDPAKRAATFAQLQSVWNSKQ